MADQHHQHHHHRNHHHHRPQRILVPPRATVPFTTRQQSTPTPTPSKSKHHLLPQPNNNKSSLSFLFLFLFSLRSLYSLLPFLRSSPSFSLFPFSFLVSLLSFILTFSVSIFSHPKNRCVAVLSISSLTQSQLKHLLFKSLVLAIVFLSRFQALRYCGTAAMILAELSGNVAFRFVSRGSNGRDQDRGRFRVRGFFALFVGLFLLSVSWDRIDCFPLSYGNVQKIRVLSVVVDGKCLRLGPMLLPFLSGFLGCYERDMMNWWSIRQLGGKRVQLISLFFTTAMLFFPALITMLVFEAEGGEVSVMNLGWSLANTVLFGVLLNEWYRDDKWVSPRDSEKEFLVTFVCTIILELVYFPELSLWGLLICGLFLWIAVRQLSHVHASNVEAGGESSETFSAIVMRPIRHVLSERKSRKIALFLLINTGYMVVEFVAGFMSNSLGLISDACHMLFDCAALAIGLYASYISRLPANSQFNYGRGRFEVLSGYANAVFLVLVGALIVLESLERILDPQEISTDSLLAVSIGGLLVNVVGLIFFHEEHHHAHGGSCSHSQSHSHSHHDHNHSHDHAADMNHHSVSYEKSSDHNECGHNSHHDHREFHHHDNHEHGHDHGCHDHHHEQGHTREHHDHGHSHGQHDHHHEPPHLHDHHDHRHEPGHRHDHHDHCSSHGHHDHHHEQGHHHDHHHDEKDACMSIVHVQGEASCSHSHGLDSKNKPSSHHKHIDHNMEGIFLHVLADTMGSVGVVLSTLLIKYKGWLVADPACSIFISALIILSVIPLLRNSGEILLQRVPRAHEHDLKTAVEDVMKTKGVCGIQNLHVWSLTNTDVIGSLHLRMSSEIDKVATKECISRIFRDAGVKDLTLQVECVKNS